MSKKNEMECFLRFFKHCSSIMLLIDPHNGAILHANESAVSYYGYTHEELTSMPIYTINMLSTQEINAEIAHALKEDRNHFNFMHRLASGKIRDVEVYATPVMIDDKNLLFSIIHDVTEQKRTKDMYMQSEARFRELFKNIPNVSVQGYTMDGRTTYWNKASEILYGYTEQEALGENLLDLIIPSFMYDGVKEAIAQMALSKVPIPAAHLQLMRKDGTLVDVFSSHAIVEIPFRGPELFCIDIDLSEQKAAEAKLERAAHYDALTNLPNRVLLFDRLNHEMIKAQRRRHSLSIAYIDLDGFKEVNDQYGHEFGDKVLIEIAAQMKATMREGDTLARLGGDEFVATFIDLETAQECLIAVEPLLKAASVPLHVDDTIVSVSASIGVALYPNDAEDADQLMRYADQAMYKAKQKGKNRYCFFGEETP